MPVRKRKAFGWITEFFSKQRQAFCRIVSDFCRTQLSQVAMSVAVESHANFGGTHLAHLRPGERLPKVRKFLSVRAVSRRRSIESFYLLARNQAGAKKEIQLDSEFSGDGPGDQIIISKPIIERDQCRAARKLAIASRGLIEFLEGE
jgi:hypothetical protein